MVAERQPQSARAQEASLRAKHDQTYKAFYAIVQTLQGLLYGYVPDLLKGAEKWFESFDFENAELLPTEHITPDLTRRYIDMLWRVPTVGPRRASVIRLISDESTHPPSASIAQLLVE